VESSAETTGPVTIDLVTIGLVTIDPVTIGLVTIDPVTIDLGLVQTGAATEAAVAISVETTVLVGTVPVGTVPGSSERVLGVGRGARFVRQRTSWPGLLRLRQRDRAVG
jgi:hypothetical protein